MSVPSYGEQMSWGYATSISQMTSSNRINMKIRHQVTLLATAGSLIFNSANLCASDLDDRIESVAKKSHVSAFSIAKLKQSKPCT